MWGDDRGKCGEIVGRGGGGSNSEMVMEMVDGLGRCRGECGEMAG